MAIYCYIILNVSASSSEPK